MEGKILGVLLYLGVIFYLGYKAWKKTKESTDYMLAGRTMNPFVLAMSYGATFVSTSAIIGFGGAAGLFGMSLLWLTFLTIFVGIFVAMVFFGKRTRRMGLALDTHTFPELLGRRYNSKFIQQFSGVVIFVFIPVYAAAVLIGICRMLEVAFPAITYEAWLLIVTAIVALYVVTGGLKAVMYTDAFQGTIMAVMMLILIITTYYILGGVTEAHQALTDMVAMMPEKLLKGGVTGWTTGPNVQSPLGLTIYTTIIYGVGIGVLAQPQLAIRYMTVPSDRELNRAVAIGGVFILLLTGVAFVVGALSNVVFFKETGQIAIVVAKNNLDKIIPAYIDSFMPGWFSGLFLVAMFAAAMSTMSSQYHVGGTSLSRDFLEQHVKNRQWRLLHETQPAGRDHRHHRYPDLGLAAARWRHRPGHGFLLRPVRGVLPAHLRAGPVLERHDQDRSQDIHGRRVRLLHVLAALRARQGSLLHRLVPGDLRQGHPGGRRHAHVLAVAVAVRGPKRGRPARVPGSGRGREPGHPTNGTETPGPLLGRTLLTIRN